MTPNRERAMVGLFVSNCCGHIGNHNCRRLGPDGPLGILPFVCT